MLLGDLALNLEILFDKSVLLIVRFGEEKLRSFNSKEQDIRRGGGDSKRFIKVKLEINLI